MKKSDNIDRSLEIMLDDTFLSGYGNASSQKVLDLGYHKSGESFYLNIKDDDGLGYLPSDPIIVTENLKPLQEALSE